MSKQIYIARDGNRLLVGANGAGELPDAIPDSAYQVLISELSYVEKKFLQGKELRDARKNNKPTVKLKHWDCFSLDLKYRLFTSFGFLPRILRALRETGHEVCYTDLSPPPDPVVFEPRWDRIHDGKIVLRHRQDELLHKILENPDGRFMMPPGYGKAQPLSSEVQTPFGPMRMGDVAVGDLVSHPDGGTSRVLAVHPQGEKEIYRITLADGDYVECCGEHLWEVDAPKLRFKGPRVLSTARIFQSYQAPAGRRYYFIRLPLPAYGVETKLPIPPYTLGVLIGDGCILRSSVTYSKPDEAVRCRVSAELPATMVMHSDDRRHRHALVNAKQTQPRQLSPYAEALTRLGLLGKKSPEKFIPDLYLTAAAAQRWALLQGLMDTDGTVEAEGKAVTYSTSSPRLAVDFKRLVESLGGVCRVRSKETSHLVSYRCSVHMDCASRVFSLPRKRERVVERSKYPAKRIIAKVEKIGRQPAQCITVSAADGLYMTNHFVVTHNSFLIALAAKALPKAKIAVVTRRCPVLATRLYPELCGMLPSVGIVGCGQRKKGCRVMCYTAASLHHCPDDVDILFGDEAHELAADDSAYKLSRFKRTRRYGLSATFDMRLDNKDMRCEAIFGPLRMVVTYKEAENAGLIVPIEVRWRNVVMETDPCADYLDTEKKRHGIWRNDYRNNLIAEDAFSYSDNTQILITCEVIEHVLAAKRLIPEGIPVYHEEGMQPSDYRYFEAEGLIPPDFVPMTKERKEERICNLINGKPSIFIANTVLNVGVDTKYLQVLVRADAGGSPLNDTQLPGRASRINDRGKSVGRVHDYLDQFNAGFRRKAENRYLSYDLNGWDNLLPDSSGSNWAARQDEK